MQPRTLEVPAAHSAILSAVNDLLDSLGAPLIPETWDDGIPERITAMARYVRRSAAGDPSKRAALSELARRVPGPSPDYRAMHDRACHLARVDNIPYADAYAQVAKVL